MTQNKKTKTKSSARTANKKSAGKQPEIETVPLDDPDPDAETTIQTGNPGVSESGDAAAANDAGGDIAASDEDRIAELEAEIETLKP